MVSSDLAYSVFLAAFGWVLHISLLGHVVLEEVDGRRQSRRLVLELVVGLDLEGPNVGGKQPSQLGSSWQSPPQRRSW